MFKTRKTTGILFASSGATLWAISGISGQILFNQFHFSATWLVSARLLIAGLLLLFVTSIKNKSDFIWPFKNLKILFPYKPFQF